MKKKYKQKKPEDSWHTYPSGKCYCSIHNSWFKQGDWCINCYPNRHPPISTGTSKTKEGVSSKGIDGLSNREFSAFKYYNHKPKLTFVEIGDRMGISKQRVSVLVQNAKKKLGIGVDSKGVPLTSRKGFGVDKKSPLKKRHKLSWHAEEITVDIEPIDFVAVKLVKWSNTHYWKKDSSEYHIKVFKKKIKVNFKLHIEGFERERISIEADRRCVNFLRNINRFLNRHGLKGKVVLKDKGRFLRVKRHWAIRGTGLAKKLRDDKRDLYVYDRETGELSLFFDLSEPGGHIESPNVKKGDVIVDKTKRVFDEYIHDDVYSPKESSDKIDLLMKNFVKSTDEAANMFKWMAKNNKSHQSVLEGMKQEQKVFNKVLRQMESTLRKLEKKL